MKGHGGGSGERYKGNVVQLRDGKDVRDGVVWLRGGHMGERVNKEKMKIRGGEGGQKKGRGSDRGC